MLPDLNIGMTLAIFSSSGKNPSFIELFTRWVNGLLYSIDSILF